MSKQASGVKLAVLLVIWTIKLPRTRIFPRWGISEPSWGTAEVNPAVRKVETAAGARSSPARKLSQKADSYLRRQSDHRGRDDGSGGLGASKRAKTLCRCGFFVSSCGNGSPVPVSLYPDSSSQRGAETGGDNNNSGG